MSALGSRRQRLAWGPWSALLSARAVRNSRPQPLVSSPKTRDGVRRHLISILIATTIPILLFGSSATYLEAQASRAAARRHVAATLRSIARTVTAALESETEVAEALAVMPSLDSPDLASFYPQAQRVAAQRPLWETVSLADPNGMQILNLLRPLGGPLGPVADRSTFEAAVKTQRPTIGDLGPVGPVSGTRLISLAVPVVRGGRLRFVLTVGLSPREMQGILGSAGAPQSWIGAIVDGAGTIVARTRKQEEVGHPADASTQQANARAPEGFYRAQTLEGIDVETTYRRLPGTGGWSVHFGIPQDELDGPVSRSVDLLAAGSLASLVLGGSLAFVISHDLGQRRTEENERAALALAASEDRGSLAVEAADFGTWRWDPMRQEVSVSPRTCLFFGLIPHGPETRWPLRLFLKAIHEEDRPAVEEALRLCQLNGDPVNVEFRARTKSQDFRWFCAKGRPLGQPEPGPNGANSVPVHGVLSDIQNHKKGKAERLTLFQRLADARENEQRRIARELHDQIGQSVTGLALGLKNLDKLLTLRQCEDEALDQQMGSLLSLAVEIGQDLHKVAADLRPAALDDLGLEQALATLAKDCDRQGDLAIDLQTIGLEQRLPSPVETAVYRVVQEGLTNVLKHADAKNVSIVIERRGDQVRAVVEDDGRGFVPSECESGQHSNSERACLGLLGMRERLALLRGSLRIEAAPGAGTALFIDVPVQVTA